MGWGDCMKSYQYTGWVVNLFYLLATSFFPGNADRPLLLCGTLSTSSALVSATISLPPAAALSSTSHFCPPLCPLPDSLSILQMVRILASSCWPGDSPSSSCSFPNGPGRPGDWGFLPYFFQLDLPAFLLWIHPVALGFLGSETVFLLLPRKAFY